LEEIVEVMYRGKKVKVHVGEITFGQEMQILKKHAKVNIVGRGVKVDIDAFGYLEDLTVMAIKKVEPEGAMPITKEAIMELSREDGRKLQDAALRCNPFRVER